MLRVFKRSLSRDLKVSKGIWSDFSNRAESLKIQSLASPNTRLNYHSPNLIDETFEKAYDLLQNDSEQLYKELQNNKSLSPKTKEKLSIEAEKHNPEVLFNLTFGDATKLDLTQPIYRNHLYKQWKSYDLQVLMQRLEQFKVIPDTMPTLDPKIDVKIKFPTNNPEFINWITPGEILPSFITKFPPMIKLQLFESLPENTENQLFTIVLVNPDDPDLSTNSFKTTLNYGLANVPINLTKNTIDVSDYLSESSPFQTFRSYTPILPEINAGEYQRCCLWVFKHNDSAPITIAENDVKPDNFDIRQFAETHNLTAVGAHVWRQVFDRSVNDVRKLYGLPNGRVFHRVRRPHPLK